MVKTSNLNLIIVSQNALLRKCAMHTFYATLVKYIQISHVKYN